MTAWKVPTGPYRLVPHPLDVLGPPPPPGPDYETAELKEATDYANALVRADEYREEADRLREDADRAEDDADKADRDAAGIAKTLTEFHARLAAAIKDDPDKFTKTEAVRRWLNGGDQ